MISIISFLWMITGSLVHGQTLTGSIQGTVLEYGSHHPMSYVNVVLVHDSLKVGTITDQNGRFILHHIPVGRRSLIFSFAGYESVVVDDIIINSGKTVSVTANMLEQQVELKGAVVSVKRGGEKPLNNLVTVSAKQLNMEEAGRYAGGFDDPARLVSAFAGVSAGSGDNNAFSVRGNSPKGTLWQIEGVPVNNPNHFGEITGFGGGGITALSSRTIGNSDFLMGAFPAEYGNALSSVFDLKIRNGNSLKHQRSVQLGVLGIDLCSEGPIKKEHGSNYLMNYRYSTFGLLGLGIEYQDISFKVNLPTRKHGIFSIWGLGLTDGVNNKPDTDTTASVNSNQTGYQWQFYDDISTESAEISTGIGGFSHKLLVGESGFLKTTISLSANQLKWDNSRLDTNFQENHPLNKTDYQTLDFRLASTYNYRFNKRHMNRSGLLVTNLNYNFDIQSTPKFGEPLERIAADNGRSTLVQAFTQSSLKRSGFTINPGVHILYFKLNNAVSVEPRLGVQYKLNLRNSVSFGYGLHSQLEKLSFYLADVPGNGKSRQLNRGLDLAKSHHVVLGFEHRLNAVTRFRIEPYYQYLFNVPVVQNSHISFLNLSNDFFFNQQLVNEGTGVNKGIDLTLERKMSKGFYYLVTFSAFSSTYVGGDDIRRSTHFNREKVGNALMGKEWLLKNKSLLNVNMRYTYLGGLWTHPVDQESSLQIKDVVEDFSSPFSVQQPSSHVVSATINYQVNHKKAISTWSAQVINLTGAKEYYGAQYNFRYHRVEENTDVIILPNLRYRVEF